jgi:hypothetical protein
MYATLPGTSGTSPGRRHFSWPFEGRWWKPAFTTKDGRPYGQSDATRIRNLSKAGALIAAEIDRRSRIAYENWFSPASSDTGGAGAGDRWNLLREIKDWCAEEAAEASGEKRAAFQRVELRLATLTAGPPTQGDIAWAKSVMADRTSPQQPVGGDDNAAG